MVLFIKCKAPLLWLHAVTNNKPLNLNWILASGKGYGLWVWFIGYGLKPNA